MKTLVHSDTKDVRLFASLAAMGFAWEESGAVQGGERTWIFSELSDCGKWKIGDMLKAWRDRSFHEQNGSHPFHHIKAAMASNLVFRSMFRDGGGFHQVRRGDALLAMESDTLPSETFNPRSTPDLEFAAALCAVGFEIRRCGNRGRLTLLGASERSTTLPWTWEQVHGWWRDENFTAANGQHVFAYVKAAVVTYAAALASIHHDRPLVKWSPPGSVGFAYIHPDCSSETEEKVAGWLSGS